MARPREFDESEAIERATDVFWAMGYQDASLPDLLDGMGLTRGSLYKAFKDKKNLYLLVLAHYELASVDSGVAKLTAADGPDGAVRIMAFFNSVAEAVKGGDQRGCLLCTAAAGPEMDDPEIAKAVHQGLAKLREGLQAALDLSAAHRHGPEIEKHALANVLLTQYVGLRVLTRSGLPLGIVEDPRSHAATLLSAQCY